VFFRHGDADDGAEAKGRVGLMFRLTKRKGDHVSSSCFQFNVQLKTSAFMHLFDAFDHGARVHNKQYGLEFLIDSSA